MYSLLVPESEVQNHYHLVEIRVLAWLRSVRDSRRESFLEAFSKWLESVRRLHQSVAKSFGVGVLDNLSSNSLFINVGR